MKEVTVQFASCRKIVVNNVVDYVESEDFYVIITNEKEHITLFRNQMEYMVVKDLEEPANSTPLPKGHGRKFDKIVVDYPPAELCTYPEYRGKPYFSIKYEENGEHFVGFGTYSPEVLSGFLQEYFISPAEAESENRYEQNRITDL